MVAQQGLTVVLADDDPMFRVVLADALQRRGCRVYACENGMTALYYLRTLKEAVHLVVTDLMMPGIDGNELARLASAERPTSKVIRYTERYGSSATPGAPLPKPTTMKELDLFADVLVERG